MRIIAYISLILILSIFSCSRDINNPYDPESETDFSPVNVRIIRISPYVLEVQWDYRTTTIDSLIIDRMEDSGEWKMNAAGAIDNNINSWTDYDCQPNTTYTYRLYTKAGQNSSYPVTVEATTPKGNSTGTFTDSRDGRQYKWVKIGDQTWMAENFAYLPHVCFLELDCGIWVVGYSGENVSEAKQSGDFPENCLYDWETAHELAPQGWHLPTEEEWIQLINYLGGPEIAPQKLLTAGYNGGTNESGFTALPGCMRFNLFGRGGDATGYYCLSQEYWIAMAQWAVDEGWSLRDWRDFSMGDVECYSIYGDEVYQHYRQYYEGLSVRYVKD